MAESRRGQKPSNIFEVLHSNRELRAINENLLDENSKLTKKNKDLLEINALQKDIINRLELTLMSKVVN